LLIVWHVTSNVHEPGRIQLEVAGHLAHYREVDTIVSLRAVVLIGPIGGIAYVRIGA
jgi:hypothetical protein